MTCLKALSLNTVTLGVRASTCEFGGNTDQSIWASGLQNQTSPDYLGHIQLSGTGFSNIGMHQNQQNLEILLRQILELHPQGQQVKGEVNQCDPILLLVSGNSSFSLNVSIVHLTLLGY